jgi:hypothetical protein
MAGFIFDTFHTFTYALFGLAALLIGCSVIIYHKAYFVNMDSSTQLDNG